MEIITRDTQSSFLKFSKNIVALILNYDFLCNADLLNIQLTDWSLSNFESLVAATLQ